jgi:hypothetical protein
MIAKGSRIAAVVLGLTVAVLAAPSGPCPLAGVGGCCTSGDALAGPAGPAASHCPDTGFQDACTDAAGHEGAAGGGSPCSGGICPGGCAHCLLPCCTGLVFAPGASAAPAVTYAPTTDCLPPAAPPLAGRLAARDLDRPPRA